MNPYNGKYLGLTPDLVERPTPLSKTHIRRGSENIQIAVSKKLGGVSNYDDSLL